MQETISIGDKTYTMTRRLSVGEVKAIRDVNKSLLGLNQDIIANGSDADLQDITRRILEKTDEQDAQIAQIIKATCGLTDEQLNALDYLDAILLFNTIYDKSTIIKKT